MSQRRAGLGDFIRDQRELAGLTQRQLADLARVSNPYLSQIERGLYRPSAEVLKNLAEALGISAESLFTRAGLLGDPTDAEARDVETAIRLDERLGTDQKEALLCVYRSFLTGAGRGRTRPTTP